MFVLCKRIAVLLLIFAISSFALGPAPQFTEQELQFHADVPLGVQGFILNPSGVPIYIMATAQSEAMEGMHQGQVGDTRVLLDAQGRQVGFYPAQVTFRLTATAWPQKLLEVGTFPVEAQQSTNDYLLGLRFQLKIFRALNSTTVVPANVTALGMPPDVPYNERIYSIAFDLHRVPIDDRVVLEVLSPGGERLCKFHLDLQ